MLYLKAFNKEGNLVAVSEEVINDVGQLTIRNLQPNTFYESGEFYVKWIGDKFSSGKIPLPSFITLQGSKKEFVFYWNDALVIETKTAYDIAVENGFKGTESEWVETIKGDPGKDGSDGKDGADSYELALRNGFKGTQKEWLNSLKGEPGKDFKYSDFTKEQLENLKGEPGKDFKYSDFTKEQLENLKGSKGDQGENAYEIALKNGFEGSLSEWLKSLEGEKGEPGENTYELALKNGFEGTMSDWLQSLKGEPGKDFKYSDFTKEQLEQLKPTLPDFSDWQKFKLTQDDGSVITDFNLNVDFNDVEQLKSLPNGVRYITKTSNLPSNISSGYGWVLKLSRPDIQMFSIYFQPYNSNQIVQKTFYGYLSDWRYISGNQTDTGWLPLPLINGASQAGTANLPKYRLVSINDTNMLFFQGAVKGISSSTMAFSRLPTNISQKINSYAEYSKVKINPYTNTSAIYNITMTTSGELKITFEPNSTADTNTPYYIEGTISL